MICPTRSSNRYRTVGGSPGWPGELTRRHLNRVGNHIARELGMACSSVYRLLEEAGTGWRFREVPKNALPK